MLKKPKLLLVLTIWLTISHNSIGGPVQTRIVGGVPTVPGEFPWMISVQFNSIVGVQYICGGTLVNATHIVTAAHCADYSEKDLIIVAGAYNIKNTEASQQKRVPIAKYIHPEYQNGDLIRHDFAMLEVSPPFELNSRVSPVPLPEEYHNASGLCWIAGWGVTETGQPSDELRKARIPIVPRDVCHAIYPELDLENQICAAHPDGGVDFCTYDTGGPLLCDDIGHVYLAGIASWGRQCAVKGYPGVYTEVSVYKKNMA